MMTIENRCIWYKAKLPKPPSNVHKKETRLWGWQFSLWQCPILTKWCEKRVNRRRYMVGNTWNCPNSSDNRERNPKLRAQRNPEWIIIIFLFTILVCGECLLLLSFSWRYWSSTTSHLGVRCLMIIITRIRIIAKVWALSASTTVNFVLVCLNFR